MKEAVWTLLFHTEMAVNIKGIRGWKIKCGLKAEV